MQRQLDSKSAAIDKANHDLGPNIERLRSDAEVAQARVQEYKAAHNLMSVEGGTMAEQEVSTLNEQIAKAKADTAEHQARLVTALLQSGTDSRDRLAALVRAHVQAHTDYPMLAVVANNEMHALSPAAAAPAAAVRRQSEALLAEVLAMGHQQGAFDVVHLEATAAAIGGMGIRVASWYPTPKAGLTPSQLADVYASLALRMAGVRPQ